MRRRYAGPVWPSVGPDYSENPYKFASQYWPETQERRLRHVEFMAKTDELLQRIDRAEWRRDRSMCAGGVVRL